MLFILRDKGKEVKEGKRVLKIFFKEKRRL